MTKKEKNAIREYMKAAGELVKVVGNKMQGNNEPYDDLGCMLARQDAALAVLLPMLETTPDTPEHLCCACCGAYMGFSYDLAHDIDHDEARAEEAKREEDRFCFDRDDFGLDG